MTKKLFTEFPPVTTEQWDEVIIKDLKGGDYEKKLVWRTLEGFSVRPYYRAENLKDIPFTGIAPGVFPYVRGVEANNKWLTRQDYCLCEGIEEANALALDGLCKGVESVGFRINGKEGLDKAGFAKLLKDIVLPAVEINFTHCMPRTAVETVKAFIEYVKEQGIKPEEVHASFDVSPLHMLTVRGTLNPAKGYEILAECIRLTADYPHVQVVNVQGYDFNDAGAGIVQELAFSLAIGSDYMAGLTALGLDASLIASKMRFTLAVSSNYFMEIAKFRAARVLWANIAKAYGAKEEACKICTHAVTSAWNQTVYDAYVNMLRGTTEAMSAAVAGVHSLTVLPFDHAFRKPGEFSNRIARNVQSILKEESRFDKIVDPAAGSYYIETLTNSIINAAWTLFKTVEEKGGYLEAFKAGFVQGEIKATAEKRDKNIATRRDTILGTNQYPNFLEKASDEITEDIVTRGAKKCCCACKDESEKIAEPLEKYRGAQVFEAMRLATDRSKHQPIVFMLTFGNLAMCRARAQFSCNFFAVAGFKVVDNNRFASVEEGIKAALDAKADIVVACSADDEYLEAVPQIAKGIGDKAVVVVAGDPECRPQLEEQGIKNYIHVRCNILDTLKEYQKMMGISELK